MADTIKCLGEINVRDGLVSTILEVVVVIIEMHYTAALELARKSVYYSQYFLEIKRSRN